MVITNLLNFFSQLSQISPAPTPPKGRLSIFVSNHEPNPGDIVTIRATAPADFIPPIKAEASFGGSYAVVFPSTSQTLSIDGSFTSREPGVAQGTITVTDSKGNQAKGSLTIKIKCLANWTCSDWSLCQNGIQTRTCQDENNCQTEEGKPVEQQSCQGATPTVKKEGGGGIPSWCKESNPGDILYQIYCRGDRPAGTIGGE